MKSKLKIILFIFISSLFFSCSFLSQLQKDSRKGVVYIQLPGSGSEALERSIGVAEQKLRAKQSFLIYNITIKDGEEVIEEKEADGGTKVELYLEAGNYVLDVVAFDTDDKDKKYPLYKGTVDIMVKAQTITTVSLIMKRIIHADFDKGPKGAYNWDHLSQKYIWDGKVFDYCEGFDKVIKKGDCATVTLKGKANTDFKGLFYGAFGKDNYGYASEIAVESKQVEFKAGEDVEISFDLIAEMETKSKDDLLFCLYYSSEDLNDSMSFNEMSIDFNFEPVFSVVNPVTISVVLPEYTKDNVSISKADVDDGYKFTCVEDELTNKNIKLASYSWFLSLAGEEKTVSTENTFVLTNKALEDYENGVYSLSIVAYDENGRMYASTASVTVSNSNKKPVENVKEGLDIEVFFPGYLTGELEIKEGEQTENGITFTCDAQKLTSRGIRLTSYSWVISDVTSEKKVSSGNSYAFTKEEAAKLANGIYSLSLTAFDSDGKMYAAVAYIKVSNADGALVQDVQEGHTISVTLPEYTAGIVKISETTTDSGVLYTIKDGDGKEISNIDFCIWSLDDETVSTKASYELTTAKKESLGSGTYALSVFIKTKNGVYASDTLYISK